MQNIWVSGFWLGCKCPRVLDAEYLGYKLPAVPPEVKLLEVLGRGLSGIVYRGMFEEREVVVKIFESRVRCENEKSTLRFLASSEIYPKYVIPGEMGLH